MPGPADDLDLQERDGGVLLPVQAKPGARRTGFLGLHAGRARIGVAAPPEKGKANDELLRLLADILDVRRSQIELASGGASRQKVFRISGVSTAQVRAKFASAAGSAEGGE